MKHYTKILLLVTLALLLPLTACTLSASKAPVATPTPAGEAPFPFTTPDAMGTIKTQTAVALTPVVAATNTPKVVVATAVPTKAPETVTNPSTTTKDEQSGGGVTIPAVARPTTYTLQKGEWPICIARRFNLDLSSFFASNGLSMQSKPAVGVVLKIPASGTWSANYGARALKAHPTTYTVVSGDTIYTIACRYGDVAPEQILAANSLSSAGDIKSGMKLNIP
ncbi:MAG: LysM peptidoglycan-binding domain-containing protein [Anaerolineaceae bacterium]|nr:LysM peptidoglycan-binding domain-containing protein [Anaerolineaceae bacterium]